MKSYLSFFAAAFFCCSSIIAQKYDSFGYCGAIEEGGNGKNITWILSNENTLSLLGSGKMNDWELFLSNSPWSGSFFSDVNIDDRISYIGEGAFLNCGSFDFIKLPENLSEIGDFAFKGCSKLDSIVFFNNIMFVGNAAFEGTPWYDKQPDGELYIAKAFYKYKGVMPMNYDVIIKPGTKSISDFAFCCFDNRDYVIQNTNLKSVDLPVSLECISDGAFYFCSEIDSIVFPENVRYIGNNAFKNCFSLKYIEVLAVDPPALGNDVFDLVPIDAEVSVPELSLPLYLNSPQWNDIISKKRSGFCGFDDEEQISKNISWVFTPDGTLSISGSGKMMIELFSADYPWHKFRHDIKNIIISDGISSIGKSAFNDFDALESVSVMTTVPPKIYEDSFPMENDKIVFSVPDESLSLFKNSIIWKKLIDKE